MCEKGVPEPRLDLAAYYQALSRLDQGMGRRQASRVLKRDCGSWAIFTNCKFDLQFVNKP